MIAGGKEYTNPVSGESRGGTQSLAKATAHGKPRGEQSHHPLGGGEEAPGA